MLRAFPACCGFHFPLELCKTRRGKIDAHACISFHHTRAVRYYEILLDNGKDRRAAWDELMYDVFIASEVVKS